MVRSVFTQALLTNTALYDKGYDLDRTCDLCGRAPDTVLHRWLHCEHQEAVAARAKLSAEMLSFAREAGDEEVSLLERGWAPTRGAPGPPPAEEDEVVLRDLQCHARCVAQPYGRGVASTSDRRSLP